MITILTPFKGKMTVIARGVRKILSRRSGSVELLNRSKLTIYQGQGMPVLTEAQSINTYPKLKSDLTLSSYASHLSEITQRLIPEDTPQPEIFNLFVSVLEILEKNPRQIFVRAYEIKLLSVLGFWSVSQVATTDELKNLLHKIQIGSWEDIAGISLNQAQAVELERIMRYYLERVLEAPLKSLDVIKKLKEE
jgi:recombinational DNA repair protein (RecF pathway)